MINPKKFISALKKNKINFFTGVPDSMFSSLCSTLQIKEKKNQILSSNEGSSVGLAIGYHLATGKIPLVYLQNSGIGSSLKAFDPAFYAILPSLYSVFYHTNIGTFNTHSSTSKRSADRRASFKHSG